MGLGSRVGVLLGLVLVSLVLVGLGDIVDVVAVGLLLLGRTLLVVASLVSSSGVVVHGGGLVVVVVDVNRTKFGIRMVIAASSGSAYIAAPTLSEAKAHVPRVSLEGRSYLSFPSWSFSGYSYGLCGLNLRAAWFQNKPPKSSQVKAETFLLLLSASDV